MEMRKYSLRTYFIFSSIALLIVLFLSHVVVKEIYINPQLENLEKELHTLELQRISQEFNQQKEILENYVGDYAQWDDSIKFVNNISTQEYISTTLIESTFENFEIDMIYYFDKNDKVFWEGHYSPEKDLFITREFDSSIFLLLKKTPLNSNLVTSSIIDTKYGPMMYSLSYITTSDNDFSQYNGFIVFGMFIDEMFEESLEKSLLLPLDIEGIKKSDLDSIENKKSIIYYHKVNAYDGELTISVDLEKKVSSSSYFSKDIIVIFILFSIFSIVFFLFIEKNVLCPIDKITRDIKQDKPSNKKNKFRVKEFDLLSQTFSSLIQRLISKQEKLSKQAYLDHLTDTYNKRYLKKICDEIKNDQRLVNKNYGMVLIDIDHYKAYNDSYGHEQGDEVLKLMGKELNNSIRKKENDFVFRYGGEEFLLIFSNISKKSLTSIIKRLQQRIQKLNIEHKKSTTSNKLTISGSYMIKKLEFGKDILTDFKILDLALYHAKNNGRNQFIDVDKKK